MADLYETLGVSREASADEIKKSYRKLARELHPDVNPDPAVQDRFKEITAAYEVLSDPNKRSNFDRGGQGFNFGPGGAGGGYQTLRVQKALENISNRSFYLRVLFVI